MQQGIWWHVIFILKRVINSCSILWLIPKQSQRSRGGGAGREVLCVRLIVCRLLRRNKLKREHHERNWSPLGGLWTKSGETCSAWCLQQIQISNVWKWSWKTPFQYTACLLFTCFPVPWWRRLYCKLYYCSLLSSVALYSSVLVIIISTL